MELKLFRNDIVSVMVATAAALTIAIMAVASLQLEQQQVANGSIGPINSPINRPLQVPSPGPFSPSGNEGESVPSENNGGNSNTIQRDEEGPNTKVPIAISEDNIFFAWWTNRTGNDEVQFRASTDGGVTFADKINLSNSTDAESQDVDIAAEGNNVFVTWWERNATSNTPVLRISNDNGETFGPDLILAANGTINSDSDEE